MSNGWIFIIHRQLIILPKFYVLNVVLSLSSARPDGQHFRQWALVEAFDLFKYDLNNDTGRYIPQLHLCQESLIQEVIDYVMKQAANVMFSWSKKVEQLKEEGKTALAEECGDQFEKFKVTLSRISYGFLAQHLLNTLTAFKAGKNWKSAGAAVGASLCQLGATLFMLDNASRGS